MCFDPVSAFAAVKATVAGLGTALSGAGGAAAGAGGAAAGAGSAWGTLGTVATAGSGLISAYSAVQNGNAQAEAANAMAKQQDQAAQQALEAGDREALLQQRRAAALQGENKVALAASGIDVNSTAALDLLGDSQLQANEDLFAIRTDAARTASGYGQQAASSRTAAQSARSQGRWGAVNTLLQTGAKVGDRYRPLVQQNRVRAQGGY